MRFIIVIGLSSLIYFALVVILSTFFKKVRFQVYLGLVVIFSLFGFAYGVSFNIRELIGHTEAPLLQALRWPEAFWTPANAKDCFLSLGISLAKLLIPVIGWAVCIADAPMESYRDETGKVRLREGKPDKEDSAAAALWLLGLLYGAASSMAFIARIVVYLMT